MSKNSNMFHPRQATCPPFVSLNSEIDGVARSEAPRFRPLHSAHALLFWLTPRLKD